MQNVNKVKFRKWRKQTGLDLDWSIFDICRSFFEWGCGYNFFTTVMNLYKASKINNMHNWQLHLPWIFIVSKAVLIGHITWFSVVQSARNKRDLRTRDKQLIRLQIIYKHPCWSSLDRDFSARRGSLCVVTLRTWVKQACLCLYLDLLQNTKQALHNVIQPWFNSVTFSCLVFMFTYFSIT